MKQVKVQEDNQMLLVHLFHCAPDATSSTERELTTVTVSCAMLERLVRDAEVAIAEFRETIYGAPTKETA
jgi:hypothetical protein